MEEIDRAQTIPEKIAIIQGYLKKLEDGKKERAEWRKQLEEKANRLQEQRNALKDQRKAIEDEKKQIEDLKKSDMDDDQKKAIAAQLKAVEDREKLLQSQENATEDQVKEIEIQEKHAEDAGSAQDAETILLSTTLQNLVNASPPLPPPATTSPTVPSGFLPLTPSNPTAATSSSGPSTSLRLAPPAPSESSLPAAPTFPRSQTGASSFSSLQPPQQRIMPNPPESYLPRPPQHTSEIVLTSPAFATLPIFPPRNISTQPLLVGPPTVPLGPRNATRLFWTDQLKQAFNEAIQSLGGLYSATVTAEQVKKLMEDLDVTESQIANRIQNLRRKKHPRDDDGGEARLLRFWEVRNVKRGGSLSGWICSWWMLTVGTDNLLKFTPLIRTDRFLTMFQATMMQVTISSSHLLQYRERLIAGTMFSMSVDVSRCAQSFRLTSLLC
ncbi:unnamed protein product [Brassica napus]|uniref:(rape) hypothetical protein n=1 Tax=Brassica napus TaxID=3708 RepID=A0A816LPK4_BRANA|nr:unnamed protein product [Brassica napus]